MLKIGSGPISGLVNRLRVIDSALAIADRFNVVLTLYWKSSPALNCSFDLLFERDSKSQLVE